LYQIDNLFLLAEGDQIGTRRVIDFYNLNAAIYNKNVKQEAYFAKQGKGRTFNEARAFNEALQ